MEEEHFASQLQKGNMSGTLEEQTKRLEEKHSGYGGSARSYRKHLQFNELEQRKQRKGGGVSSRVC